MLLLNIPVQSLVQYTFIIPASSSKETTDIGDETRSEKYPIYLYDNQQNMELGISVFIGVNSIILFVDLSSWRFGFLIGRNANRVEFSAIPAMQSLVVLTDDNLEDD